MSAITRVSTIIATCNRAHFLVEALDNIAAQRVPPLEVIVVDDGSGPETRRAVERWRTRQRRAAFDLRYFHQDNSGPAVARNRGVEKARGDYLHFMDDDDLMEPDTLLHLATALDGVNGAAVSMASYAMLHHGEGVTPVGEPAVAPSRQSPAERLAAMIAGHWFVPVHGYLFTRAAVARMGSWDPSLASQEDDELLLRAALRGVEFLPAPAALVYYRQHNGVRRATPGKPGETVMQGLRKRLLDDLAIRERAAQALHDQGAIERYRAAFLQWQHRLVERYGALLQELDDGASALLSWLGHRHHEAGLSNAASMRRGMKRDSLNLRKGIGVS